MNPELAHLQSKLNDILNQLYPLLQEYAQVRRISPQVRMESSKVLEQFLLQIMRMTKQVSTEYGDDLMQGISLLKLKMMQ
ncbi:MAG: hypothetical protein IJF50_00735 [Peptococcaceae bacterium]|nr:hypothetical protein [Peptococcaceae bacterium]MBQ2995186.1 hypothetical protein [Peptococcaceae bacterium]